MQHLNILIVLTGIVSVVIAATATSLTLQGAIASSDSDNNSSNSNVTLGNLIAAAQGIDETYHAINDTYALVSYLDSITLMPPNAPTINATESGNSTVHFLPNGITLVQGQGLLVTREVGDGIEENATTYFVSVGSTNPNGTGSRIGVVGTGSRIGVVYYTTNSTGDIAFLDNMVGIYQAETSQEGVTSRVWEWKGGGMLPFETGSRTPLTAMINSAPEEEQTISTTNNTSNNVSNALLSSKLLSFGKGERTSYTPINSTYAEISVMSNTIIMPPNDTTTTIDVTEKGNLSFNIQPNGIALAQGQVFLVTLDDDGTAQKENATVTIAEINRIEPDGIGSATGVAFYKTNSTGQLAFLDNMIGIYQREITPEGTTIRTWEWNGG
ncbi:MAG TPA: hypothetical protein VE130_04720 [Nitrososphaeraceae archaeon]|nr:hypothetical protein [Nitrososphaeraceae archaeon]